MLVSDETPECNRPWPNVGQRSPVAGRETDVAAALAGLSTAALRSAVSTPQVAAKQRKLKTAAVA
jgi:hypothetical protein